MTLPSEDEFAKQFEELIKDIVQIGDPLEFVRRTFGRTFAYEQILAAVLAKVTNNDEHQLRYLTHPGLAIEQRAVLGEHAAASYDNVFRRIRLLLLHVYGIPLDDHDDPDSAITAG